MLGGFLQMRRGNHAGTLSQPKTNLAHQGLDVRATVISGHLRVQVFPPPFNLNEANAYVDWSKRTMGPGFSA